MIWIIKEFRKEILKHSYKYKLNPKLIVAIIKAESSGDEYAIRFEPHFKYEYDADKMAYMNFITKDTERILQKCSIGLMQLMGCVARELGYKENLLCLTNPSDGIEVGCQKLQQLSKKYELLTDVVSAYNAGSVKFPGGPYKNYQYVEKVMKYFRECPQVGASI